MMPAGLQTFDSSGAMIFDITTWAGQVLGSFSLAASHAAGNMTDSTLTQGRPFLVVLPEEGNIGTRSTGNPIASSVTISGSTISWNAAPDACRIIYGIY